MVKTQFNKQVKIIRSDNGHEFNLHDFYKKNIVVNQSICVSTPHKKARVERMHQYILNLTMSLMFQANIPKVYWLYVVQHAVYQINRIPTKLWNNKSSHKVLYGEAHNLNII